MTYEGSYLEVYLSVVVVFVVVVDGAVHGEPARGSYLELMKDLQDNIWDFIFLTNFCGCSRSHHPW